ncbi:hypothetical protein E4665_02720 [Sporolactobacillus shoreae]|uniref:Squalene cyclase C-terminal domain-containing protein n=1 Tax=Sporolactobacillus shoreae TaxID=1465501 RepID=A0A4Z0GRD5_9BACL|nr:hypothetical protein [Sporolactobacillus shoreae]TGA99879.1 hypothetical protein E4665_02720 [Sporolactobacillus shoreae]
MKRYTTIILAFFLAILFPFTVSAATPNDFETHLTSLENYVQSGQLTQSLTDTTGQLDDWAVIALARNGVLTQENQDAYLSKLQSETNLSGTSLEKVIIALKALKQDPMSFNGRNLIGELSKDNSLSTPSANIYALIALNTYEDKLPVDAVNTPAGLIQKILSQTDQDGGWGYAGPPADVDTTGAALAALAPYQSQADVKNAINKAVQYLAGSELPDGGFSNYGENSNSAAEAVIGLTSVGIDPTTGPFDKNGKNPVSNLYTFQSGNGYMWQSGYPEDPMTNDEVLKALVAYKTFFSGGKLFVFPKAISSDPVVKVPAPVIKPSSETSGISNNTSSKKSVVQVTSETSHLAGTRKTSPVKITSVVQNTTSTVPASKAAVHSALGKTEKSPDSKAKVSGTQPKTHKAVKKRQAQATRNKKNTPQTKATRSMAVNPVFLLTGIIIFLLGAAALIYRLTIWRRRA